MFFGYLQFDEIILAKLQEMLYNTCSEGGTGMEFDLLTLIEKRMPEFSKGQRAIAAFILSHYDKAAFMTASKLGKTVGISESTVVRFASELGFDGYPELQKSLQQLISNKLTSVQRIEVTSDMLGNGDVLDKVLSADIDKIKHTLDEISRTDFDGAVNAILEAKNIYVVGVRSAQSLSDFLTFYLNLVTNNVRPVVANGQSEIFEQILHVGEGDVFIAVSFPRYSQRTIAAVNYASDRGAKIISITDDVHSPLAAKADYLLTARSDMTTFVDSLVAPFSLINALIVAVGLRKREEVSATFEQLERIWDEYEVYEKTVGHRKDSV